MSDPVGERLDALRAHLVVSPVVVAFHFLQEETAGDIGYFRVRCSLVDGSELQLAERFTNRRDGPVIDKYSYHWQRNDGTLICRWDNARIIARWRRSPTTCMQATTKTCNPIRHSMPSTHWK